MILRVRRIFFEITMFPNTAARVDEVAMAAIRVDPQILEEHLAIC